MQIMSSRTQYDADLRQLQTQMTQMGAAAADAVESAMEALCTADPDMAAAVIKGDQKINQMEQDIQHRCMSLLLRQQPVAGDLRRISAALKAVTDLERMADHAADIAEILPHLFGVRQAGDPAVSRALEMGRKAHKMILDVWQRCPLRTRPLRSRSLQRMTQWTQTLTRSSRCWRRRSQPARPMWMPHWIC